MKNYSNVKNAYYLLNSRRFDLAFKLLYLDLFKKCRVLAEHIYIDHIRAFSLGKFVEPGNNKKIGIKKFVKQFNNIYFSINQNGFNINKPLPISKNGIIINGSHRLASSLHLSKRVFTKLVKKKEPTYNFKFFIKRNVDINFIELAAIKFIEYSKNPYLAIIWPNANNKKNKVDKLIPNIIYSKSIFLNSNASKIFLSQVYNGAKWIGNRLNNFKGVNKKFIDCFNKNDPVMVCAFHCDNKKIVKEIKDNIRSICGIEKSSIHITDNKLEALYLAKLCFNKNSIHFLNNSKNNASFKTLKNIDYIKKFIKKNTLCKDDLVITGSFVLSLYGLRKFVDIDYLYNGLKKITKKFREINSHKSEEIFYQTKKNQIIYNPKYYFNFSDLKFVSFDQIYQMKKNRNETKDKNDLNIMLNYINKNQNYTLYFTLYQNIYYQAVKIRYGLIKFLKVLKLYNILKKIYYFFKQ
jgi:hypothetical protein